MTDVKKVLNFDSKIFITGAKVGVGTALAVAMGIGLPAAILCAFGAVAAGAALGIGAHAVKTYVTGGTYDDFLCGLEDTIYSGADFMASLFMTTTMAGYGKIKEMAGAASGEAVEEIATSLENAKKWGEAFYPDGAYKLIEIEVDKISLTRMYFHEKLDNIGPAYCAPLELLNKAVHYIKEVT